MKLTISCAVTCLISALTCMTGPLNHVQGKALPGHFTKTQRSELVEWQRLSRDIDGDIDGEEDSDAESDSSDVVRVPTCQAGWIRNGTTCYLFIGKHELWEVARNDCLAKDSHLLEIDSKAEQEFIDSVPQVLKATSIWIGLSDRETEGTFLLASMGNTPSYLNWRLGQPDDSLDALDCVREDPPNYNDGLWATTRCNFYFAYLCEGPAEFFAVPNTSS